MNIFLSKSFLLAKNDQYDEAFNFVYDFLKFAVTQFPRTILIERYISHIQNILPLRSKEWEWQIEENFRSGKVLLLGSSLN